MADTSATPSSLITDLIGRYGKQAVQLFAALAGATGLFYAIGFIIVNTSLLQLGVYETALISAGYVAPGIAFALIFILSAAGSAVMSAATFAILIPNNVQHLVRTVLPSVYARLDRISRRAKYALALAWSVVVMALNIIVIVGFSRLLGWVAWFGLNEASDVTTWCASVGLVVAGLLYAEYLALLRGAYQQRAERASGLLASVQARAKTPVFVAILIGLTFVSVLAYGQSVYAQVPSVFGGGQPIVVRFYGEEVSKLTQLGIDLEPGETLLTERVELIAQTEDRYIVRIADRAISFDKEFVQGIRYEPPEFFLDLAFFLTKHTRQGELFLADGAYDDALSEFELVLGRKEDHMPALRGRIVISLIESRLNLSQALDDYRTLSRTGQADAEDHYGLAELYVKSAPNPQTARLFVLNVVTELQASRALSSTIAERAQSAPVFDPMRGMVIFDKDVYGSGPAAARWFADRGKKLADGGSKSDAILAYQRAISYTELYRSEPDALTPNEIADLHAALSALHDPNSDGALDEMQKAVATTGQQDPKYLNLLADLYVRRNDTANALKTYERVLGLSTADAPNLRQALIGKGKAALDSQEYVLASAAFSQALTLSSDAATWYDFSRALAASNDPGAEAALRKAIGLDSSLAVAAQTTDWATYFSKAGSAVKNLIDGAVLYRQARAYRDQRNFEAAIAAYQSAASVDPSITASAGYWHELGDTLNDAQRYAEAVTAYQNVALPDASVLLSLGQAQIELSQITLTQTEKLKYADGAIASLSQGINALGDAAPSDVYVTLARAYELKGQFEQVALAYGEAARRESNLDQQGQYQYKSGVYLLAAGKTDQGLAALAPAIAQGGLRVETTDVSLRDAPASSANSVTLLAVGAQLRIEGSPQLADDSTVWWPVSDPSGASGFVWALSVVPGPPPAPPITQSAAPS